MHSQGGRRDEHWRRSSRGVPALASLATPVAKQPTRCHYHYALCGDWGLLELGKFYDLRRFSNKSKIETMELQIKKDREYITLLEEKVEDMQRDSRKSNIELKNVPATEKESKEELLSMILHLSKHIDCKIEKSDIRDFYRVRTRTRNGELVKNPPIIMELDSSILKRDILGKTKLFNTKNKQKLHAKHLGFTTNEDTLVFATEQLSPKGARLFFLARDLSKSKSYKFCWTSFGRVYVRKDEKCSIITIKNEAQIHHLLQEA
ncbi:unnamed protein product [Chilo suppressalis]|uniref:FP protein C-terminal domain-containing protein n=1 Tax=Chilo suppressalis TaxID=168631 RepID=A0ABN8B7J9_CHISP|nr:unnamed protein product [Chilo suppressalis]